MPGYRKMNHDVLDISMEIAERFPELSKFIAEMPVRVSSGMEISSEDLEGYYNSLHTLLNNYSQSHSGQGKLYEAL